MDIVISPEAGIAGKKELPATDGGCSRIVVLDGLRGYAILMVMCHHFFLTDTVQYKFTVIRWIVRILQSGWIGVDLFFILSGFLITGGLLESKSRPGYFLNFYGRRTLRIFPLYYGVLLLVFLVVPFFLSTGHHALGKPYEYQGWLWLYLTNFAVVIYGSWGIFSGPVFQMAHFWSLAVEEHFYLVWPFIIRWFQGWLLISACLLAITTAVIARFWIFMTSGNDATAAYILTYCRMDTLVTGALTAILVVRFGVKRLQAPALGVVLSSGLVIAWLVHSEYGLRATGSHIPVFNYTLFAIFFASLLVCIVATQKAWITQMFFCNRFMVTMGKYSYGLYVYHGLITGIFSTWITVAAVHRFIPTLFLSGLVRGSIWLCAAFACAFVSWHVYEKQFLKLKSRFR